MATRCNNNSYDGDLRNIRRKHSVDYTVTVKPMDVEIKASDEESLLDSLLKADVAIESECGGIGVCGLCRIHILEGDTSESTLEEDDHLSEEMVEAGERLACQTYPQSDLSISIP
jgi:ferredoxin